MFIIINGDSLSNGNLIIIIMALGGSITMLSFKEIMIEGIRGARSSKKNLK